MPVRFNREAIMREANLALAHRNVVIRFNTTWQEFQVKPCGLRKAETELATYHCDALDDALTTACAMAEQLMRQHGISGYGTVDCWPISVYANAPATKQYLRYVGAIGNIGLRA